MSGLRPTECGNPIPRSVRAAATKVSSVGPFDWGLATTRS